ncbi:MAG: hypothetical protein KDD61_10965 [Bdellovibrionales bacterium]|nr:hypothetical protein [Bdellovibrionales bacterium]
MLAHSKKLKDRYRTEAGAKCLDIRLKSSLQLFDQRDPAPFREKDLEDDAAEYIVGSLREIGVNTPAKIVVQLPADEEQTVSADSIKNAIHSFFTHEAFKSQQKLTLNFQQSQIAMLIGLSCLFIFIFLSHQLESFTDSFGLLMLKEALNILGWVAMWKPTELTLYAWWPVWQEKRLNDRLSRIDVEVVYEHEVASVAKDSQFQKVPG